MVDPFGTRERARYGYESYRVAGGVSGRPIVAWGVLDELGLRLEGDVTMDEVRYAEDRFSVPVAYRTSGLSSTGVLGQATATLFERSVTAVAGVRFDRHRGAELTDVQKGKAVDPRSLDDLCDGRVCYDAVSQRFGLTWSILRQAGAWRTVAHILEDLYLKVLWGTAFKAPDPVLLYHDDPRGSRPFKPNPGLRPQRVSSAEAQLGADLFARQLGVAVTVFQNTLRDLAVFERFVGGVVALNADEVDSVGVEAEVHLRLRAVTLDAGLSWQRSERRFERPFSRRIPEPAAFPDWTAFLTVGGELPWTRTFAEIGARYVGRRVGHPMNRGTDNLDNRYELPAYLLFDASLLPRPWGPDGGTALYLDVRNVLDQSYAYPGFQAYYGVDLPGEPRTVSFGIRQEL